MLISIMLNYQNVLNLLCLYLTSMLQKKQKYIRANNANFMTKSLRKAIMLRSKFRNRFSKEKTEESKGLHNKAPYIKYVGGWARGFL